MKKIRFIVGLLVVVILLAVVLTSCGKEDEVENNIKQEGNLYEDGYTINSSENYYLFQTKEVEVYLDFLENMDTTKYEIVDITTSMHTMSGSHAVSNEFYMVTYKKIAE